MRKILLPMIFLIILGSTQFALGQTDYNPPLKQISDGIEPNQVSCTQGLELVLKMSNGNPACIKPSSVEKLIERGWAIHVLPDYDKNENNNSEVFTLGENKVKTMKLSYFQNANGYLAEPVEDGQYPAVVMIHEWWGLNENIRNSASFLRNFSPEPGIGAEIGIRIKY